MGKSKRIRNDRAQDVMTSPEKYSDINATKKAKKTTLILVCVIAAIILASVALIIFSETGALARSKILYESENFEINGAMATYMYYDVYSQYYAMYGQYAQYFMSSDVTNLIGAKTLLARCEAAKAAGYELTEADLDEIDAAIKELKATLKENDSSISKMYGDGIIAKDIRDVMKIKKLASKIYDDKETEVTDKVVADNDRINKYFEENKDKFLKGDYVKVTVNAEYYTKLKEAKTEEEFKTLFIEYFVKENLLANYKSKLSTEDKEKVEALDASVYEAVEAIVAFYLTDKKIEGVELDDALDPDEVKISKDKFKEVYNKFKADGDKTTEDMYENLGKAAAEMCDKTNKAMTFKSNYAYPKKTTGSSTTTTTTAATTTGSGSTETGKTDAELATEFDEWFFKYDERKDNDVYGASDEKTVYFVSKAAIKETYITKNVGHILVKVDGKTDADFEAAKKEAQAILDQFLAGEKTKDAFETLANEKTDDSGVFYENVTKGQMVEEFENWIYDEARKVGDTGLVKTEYGYHVMYFVGDGREAWKSTAIDALISEDISAWNTDITAKYPVTIVDKNITKIFSKITGQ